MKFLRRRGEISAREDVPDWSSELNRTGWWHSFQFPSGERVAGIRSIAEMNAHLAQFQLPDNLSGKRVLDVGAWDGWFSFEMERRGAEVTAVDCWDNPKFRYAHKQFQSGVRYCIRDVYELMAGEVGHFDIVLFSGVLYHLKHPLLALERMCALSRDVVCLESYVLDGDLREARRTKRALMEFFESDELGGQTDNWVAPNSVCLLALCRTAGFARVSLKGLVDHRAYVTCHRTWEPSYDPAVAPTPVLEKAIHNLNQGINFAASRDDYISCWFVTAEQQLSRYNVQPIVGDWGTIPVSVQPRGNGLWHTNFKLPPGLEPGFYEVRLRTLKSAFSNSVKIAVDVPALAQALSITGVSDGRTWKAADIRLNPNGIIAVWVTGLPENADLNNIDVILDGRRLAVVYVSVREPSQPSQINVEVPADFPVGKAKIHIEVGNVASDSFDLTIRGDSAN
jgi:tRNA (mo5U34)-methyltransferase